MQKQSEASFLATNIIRTAHSYANKYTASSAGILLASAATSYHGVGTVQYAAEWTGFISSLVRYMLFLDTFILVKCPSRMLSISMSVWKRPDGAA